LFSAVRCRLNVYAAILTLAAAGVLALPAIVFAASGGAAIGGTIAVTKRALSTTPTGVVQPGDMTVSASGNGITVDSRASGFLRGTMRFWGRVPSAAAGSTIMIERLGHQTNWAWTRTTTATVHHGGSFTAVWPANHIGRFAIRAVLRGGARAASASPTVTVTVYRPSVSTYYGSGSWGSTTACGVILRQNTLGVAHRTLPCGTRVAFYWHGRTIVVPVIDRGPYGAADWDLTESAARALGFMEAGRVTLGAVTLPRQP
jgi:hypothetical protein